MFDVGSCWLSRKMQLDNRSGKLGSVVSGKSISRF